MRLDNLSPAHAVRVNAAKDPGAWGGCCGDPRGAAWLAWNVREDGWYGTAELATIERVINASPAALSGPELLLAISVDLKRLPPLSPIERPHLPSDAFNHLGSKHFARRYELASESVWAEGSVPGEISDTLIPGDRVRVTPRDTWFAWLSFEANGVPVPTQPDEIARHLGLSWGPTIGNVLRVKVPLGSFRATGVEICLPTLFDSLWGPGKPQPPDWRALPDAEKQPGEPWGRARDMLHDGAALPEVIADMTQAATMDAQCVGALTTDLSTRPFLNSGRPR